MPTSDEGCCGKAKRLASGAANVIRGAPRLARVELGLSILEGSDEKVKKRRSVCESCRSWEHGRCLECSCYTWGKTRVEGEKCPKGLW